MHGDRFLREYGETANRTWTEAISRMSNEQIIASLKNLSEQARPHPPTLPEFVAACRQQKPKNEFGLDYVPQCYREVRAERLLTGPRDDEAGKRHLAAMRAALRGESA